MQEIGNMIEHERQLIASWLLGYNKQDMTLVDGFLFYPEIQKALEKSSNVVEIAKKAKVQVRELTELTAEYVPTFYRQSLRILREQKLKNYITALANHPKDFKDQIKHIVDEMDKLSADTSKKPTDIATAYKRELDIRENATPLKYGIPTLDYLTGGIRRQELTTIAARPSIGKSALALQIAYNSAVKGHKVLFFPLEMSGAQLMERIVCRETTIQHERLKAPKNLSDEDKEYLNDFLVAYDDMVKGNLCIIEGVSILADIKAQIEHHNPKLVVIDQLSQLKEYKRFNSIREQFTYMTNTLKAMTMELDVPILLCAQINRSGQDKEPTLADLKESGSIEEDSDNVIMLHQNGDTFHEFVETDIIVRKQRNGARDRKVKTEYVSHKFVFREHAKL